MSKISENYTTTTVILSLENPSFSAFLLCSCLLVLKMFGVILLTIYYRFKYKAFISPEDVKWFKGEVKPEERVERVRRAHQNDLENIPAFILIAFAFLWADTPSIVNIILYFAFTIIRALHTIVYALYVVPQPTRATLWAFGFLITGYMAVHTALISFVRLIST